MGGYISRWFSRDPTPVVTDAEKKSPINDCIFEIYHHSIDCKENGFSCTFASSIQRDIIKKLVPGSRQRGEFFRWVRLPVMTEGCYAGSHFLPRSDGSNTSFLFVNNTKDTIKVKLCVDGGQGTVDRERYTLLNHYECPPGPSVHEFCDNTLNRDPMMFSPVVLLVPGYVWSLDYDLQVRVGSVWIDSKTEREPTHVLICSNINKAFICKEGMLYSEVEMKDEYKEANE